MNRFSLTHLSNEVLRRELASKAKNEKEATAELLAHIAEFDERKLVPAGGVPLDARVLRRRAGVVG